MGSECRGRLRKCTLLVFTVACLLWCGAALGQCRDDLVSLQGAWGEASFRVEVVDTPQARSRGLMHRESLPQGAGMLFVYERPQPVSFWMRNTLIPLDMIFTDERGVVTRVHHRAEPLDETPIPGGESVLTVLEINGGLAAALGIGEGTRLRHPAYGTKAAWPCP